MSRVIGIIGTPQNVNPETHFLSLLAPSLLELLEQSPLICSEPFDTAQGERNLVVIIPLLFTSNPEAKLKTTFQAPSLHPSIIGDKPSSS